MILRKTRGYTTGRRCWGIFKESKYNERSWEPTERGEAGVGQGRAARAEKRNGSRTPVLDERRVSVRDPGWIVGWRLEKVIIVVVQKKKHGQGISVGQL